MMKWHVNIVKILTYDLLELAIDGAFGAYGEASGGLLASLAILRASRAALASLANALPNFAFFIEQ